LLSPKIWETRDQPGPRVFPPARRVVERAWVRGCETGWQSTNFPMVYSIFSLALKELELCKMESGYINIILLIATIENPDYYSKSQSSCFLESHWTTA
jgi:hypothetical protein